MSYHEHYNVSLEVLILFGGDSITVFTKPKLLDSERSD